MVSARLLENEMRSYSERNIEMKSIKYNKNIFADLFDIFDKLSPHTRFFRCELGDFFMYLNYIY